MFCSNCGTEVPDDSAFCHNCGARTVTGRPREQPQETQPAPAPPSSGAGTAAPVYQAREPAAAALATRPDPLAMAIGAVVIIGAVLGIIGSVLSWVVSFNGTINAFDLGYVTSWQNGDGKDGWVIVPASVAALALALHYFFVRNVWASLAVLAMGGLVMAVATYDLYRAVKDWVDFLGWSVRDALDLFAEGIFITIMGGLMVALAALVGCFRAVAGQKRP